MAHMGGPVGQPMNTGSSVQHFNPESVMKKLNTAIYEYMICNERYDIARLINKSMDIETDPTNIKQSPKNHTNGIDSGMDIDSKEHLNMKNRPDDLPAPQSLSGMSSDHPFLQDWWCQFWDLYHAQRGKGAQKQSTLQYIAAQRNQQKQRMAQQMGNNMENGAMASAMRQAAPGQMQGNLRMQMLQQQQAAQAQQQQQQQAQAQQQQALKGNMAQGRPTNGIPPQGNQMQASGMERQGSTMNNMSEARNSGSPNPGDSAPSPKRQRLENLQQINQGRPGQPGQNNQVSPNSQQAYSSLPQHTKELLLQHNINPNSLPYDKLQQLSMQPAKNQAQSVEAYSQAMIRQQMALQHQNPNSNPNMKVMPPQNPAMGGGGGPAAAAAAAQQNVMAQQGMDSPGDFYASSRPGQTQQVPQQGGNHALQDYQMQLMLLEQQNKKRLLMARQEQDNMGGGGHPNAAQGNAGMVDPSMNPGAMRNIMGQPGQQMRPQNGHLAEQQMMMRQANQQMMPNNGFQPGGPHGPGGPQGQMMPGQQPGQPPNMTPRQGNMPPPPAPTGGAAGPNQSSSPAPPPAPPTPNQNKGGKPTKKDTKNAKVPNKKGANAAANDADAPPTPTPPPPVTPNPAGGFAQKNNNPMANGGGPPNGQNPGMQQQNQVNMNGGGAPPQQQQQQAMMGGGGDMPSFVDDLPNQFGLDYSGIESSDVLDTFDFESFLNNSNDNGDFNFDANLAFADPIGGEAEGLGS